MCREVTTRAQRLECLSSGWQSAGSDDALEFARQESGYVPYLSASRSMLDEAELAMLTSPSPISRKHTSKHKVLGGMMMFGLDQAQLSLPTYSLSRLLIPSALHASAFDVSILTSNRSTSSQVLH
jgi:hypothetical protein